MQIINSKLYVWVTTHWYNNLYIILYKTINYINNYKDSSSSFVL